jgi:hypothetical protein
MLYPKLGQSFGRAAHCFPIGLASHHHSNLESFFYRHQIAPEIQAEIWRRAPGTCCDSTILERCVTGGTCVTDACCATDYANRRPNSRQRLQISKKVKVTISKTGCGNQQLEECLSPQILPGDENSLSWVSPKNESNQRFPRLN